jgi:thiamine diphosphokinase
MKAIVFLNGEYTYSQGFIDSLFDEDTVLLCADGGANYAYKYNKTPLYIIGDLDSINKEILEYYKSLNVNIVKYNPEKDYTDFELILQKISQLEKDGCFKFNSVNILGALGKRTDLTLSNLFLMENYPNITILTEEEQVFYKEKSFSISDKKNYGFSIIPLNENIKNLTLRGFKYELECADIERKSSRLVSNIITTNMCNVNFTKGKMIVILKKPAKI